MGTQGVSTYCTTYCSVGRTKYTLIMRQDLYVAVWQCSPLLPARRNCRCIATHVVLSSQAGLSPCCGRNYFSIPSQRQRGIVGAVWAPVPAMAHSGSFRDLKSAVPLAPASLKAMGLRAADGTSETCEGGRAACRCQGPALQDEIARLEMEAAKRRKCLEGGGSCLGRPEHGKSGLQRSP